MAFAAMGDHERAWKLFSLLNPVHHGGSSDQIATYKVEPYVVAADVYAVDPHTGRGGWTWYTGSASWMYRLLIDTLLGVNLEGDKLRLDPRLPESWESYKIHYRYRQTVYHITIARGLDAPAVTSVLTLDGKEITGSILPLQDDQREHHAELKIRSSSVMNAAPSTSQLSLPVSAGGKSIRPSISSNSWLPGASRDTE
jgi:cellobiose phosphorylase